MDRVVDYDRRQRREVQMDLFAREFLLPRAWVRKLHLEDGLSATAIAERLDAPFDVVAQQLLDALLLPPISVEAEAEKAERSLNPLQEAAATHRGLPYLLEAGPGTGKTQTLTARVETLLADGIDPKRILLLTFSNKAAGEMAARIALKNKAAAAAMWIGTFHSFGLDIIQRFHVELGLPKNLRMMDRTEAVELLEKEFPRLGLTHYRDLYDPTQHIADILSAISRAKDEVVDAKTYAELAEEMRRTAATDDQRKAAERGAEVARVFEAYEALKLKTLSIDFGDLVSIPVRLLETNPAICTLLQKKYDYVLVDEYQDVNRSSVRLLTCLRPDGKNLWAVGDAKQSIYRFRGASSFNMARFGKEDFAGGVRGRLKKNYRSVSEIVDAFSAFAVGMKAGDADSGLEAHRGVGSLKPELLTTGGSEEQTVVLAETIEEMHRVGHAYRDQAVLCTGNEKLARLGEELERMGVPVLFLGSLFERPEVKDLLALLTVLSDRRAIGLIRTACWPEFKMSLGDVAAALNHLRDDQQNPAGWFGKVDGLTGVSAEGRRALSALAVVLAGFDQRSQPWTVLATLLLDRTRMAAQIGASAQPSDRARSMAIWQLMNFVRAQPAAQGLPIARLLRRIRRLVRLGDDRDLRQLPASAQGIDAVRLMTIHGAKGLEFPVVHVPGLNNDTIPRRAQPPPCPPPDGMVAGARGSSLENLQAEHAEEQECLFYVALSRARDRLFLYAPTQKADGKKRPLSPFLDRLGGTFVSRHVRPTRTLPSPPEMAAIEFAVDGPLRLDAAKVVLHESCGRRFLYTHILQIGGRRNESGFMQMHEAVRTVFKAIVSGEAPIANDAELEKRIADAFVKHGMTDHGYVDEYRKLASGMLRFFVAHRAGFTAEVPAALSISFGQEQIIVQPDDVLVRHDGSRTFRRIKTGHQRSADTDDVAAAAFLLAAKRAFPNAIVEIVSLSDESSQRLEMTERVLKNRSETLAGLLRKIRAGQFSPEPSSRVCPGCPAFFICGPLPAGRLQKKFE
jgi:superfamily I DNA/RNA helicase